MYAGAWFSWLERLPVTQEAAGSSPVAPAKLFDPNADTALLSEHLMDERNRDRALLPLQMLHVRCCHRAHDPLRKLLVREAGLEFPKGPSEQTGGSVPHQSLNATVGSGEGCVWPDLGKQGG